MTLPDALQLHKQGLLDAAYDAIRPLYAADKGPATSLAMFRIAADVLRKRVGQGRLDEARKILMALERMLPSVSGLDGSVQLAFERCQQQLAEGEAMVSAQPPEHLRMGKWGEDVAVGHLRQQGYVILERDWHSGHRDIDVIALKDGCIVFVEVKTRRNSLFGDPTAAVDYRKRRNLRLAMKHYIMYKHMDCPIRFDIITVVGSIGCLNPDIQHLEDVNIQELPWRRFH